MFCDVTYATYLSTYPDEPPAMPASLLCIASSTRGLPINWLAMLLAFAKTHKAVSEETRGLLLLSIIIYKRSVHRRYQMKQFYFTVGMPKEKLLHRWASLI